MKRLVLIAALAMAGVGVAAEASASPWIFNQSYYSHTPVAPVRVGPKPLASGPYYTRPQGQYINSGYRNLRSFINIRGQTVDQYQIFESWIQGGSQW